MTTLQKELTAGDVLEIKTADDVADDAITVLVLLATDDFVVLDTCDGLTPFVLQMEELVEYRKFTID